MRIAFARFSRFSTTRRPAESGPGTRRRVKQCRSRPIGGKPGLPALEIVRLAGQQQAFDRRSAWFQQPPFENDALPHGPRPLMSPWAAMTLRAWRCVHSDGRPHPRSLHPMEWVWVFWCLGCRPSRICQGSSQQRNRTPCARRHLRPPNAGHGSAPEPARQTPMFTAHPVIGTPTGLSCLRKARHPVRSTVNTRPRRWTLAPG